MSGKKRILALITAFAVLFAMLFSVCFIAAEVGHDCVGDSCPVCQQISICENVLKTLGVLTAAAAVCSAVSYTDFAFALCAAKSLPVSTPVFLKVKLSN